jgi:hypothetical protein
MMPFVCTLNGESSEPGLSGPKVRTMKLGSTFAPLGDRRAVGPFNVAPDDAKFGHCLFLL